MGYIINPYSVSPVAPSEPPSTNLWGRWRANDVAGSDGDEISSVTDLSGNARNLTGFANAAKSNTKPKLRTNVINGKSAFEFNGGGWFTIPAMNGIAGGAEVFFIVKGDNDPATDSLDANLHRMDTTANDNHFPLTDGNIHDGFAKTSRADFGNPSVSLSAAYLCYNLSCTTAPALTAYLNGTQQGSTSITGSYGCAAAPKIGRSASAGSCEFKGRVAEVIVYDGVLADGGADKNAVEAYFASFYGITFS